MALAVDDLRSGRPTATPETPKRNIPIRSTRTYSEYGPVMAVSLDASLSPTPSRELTVSSSATWRAASHQKLRSNTTRLHVNQCLPNHQAVLARLRDHHRVDERVGESDGREREGHNRAQMFGAPYWTYPCVRPSESFRSRRSEIS